MGRHYLPKIIRIGGVLMSDESFSIDENITVELKKLGEKGSRISRKAVRKAIPIFEEALKKIHLMKQLVIVLGKLKDEWMKKQVRNLNLNI